MNKVLYSSPWIPREWISAHSFEPVPWIPPVASDFRDPFESREGLCSLPRLFIQQARETQNVSCIIFTTPCDQMRRASEILDDGLLPHFLLNIPTAVNSPSAFPYYLSELRRLGKFLLNLGGTPPTASILKDLMKKSINREETRISSRSLIPLGVLGSPLPLEVKSTLSELLTKEGATIAVDGTEGGERTNPGTYDLSKAGLEGLFLELAQCYFAIPDIFQRPNDRFYEWVRDRISCFNLQGFILIRNISCDLWHAEVPRFKDRFGLPLLDMDWESGGDFMSSRNRNKIQAFLEGFHHGK